MKLAIYLIGTLFFCYCTNNNKNETLDSFYKANSDSIQLSDSNYVVYKNNKLCIVSNFSKLISHKFNIVVGDSLKETKNNEENILFFFKSHRVIFLDKKKLLFTSPIDSMLKENDEKIRFVYDVVYEKDMRGIVFLVKYLSYNNTNDSLLYKYQ